MFGAKVDTTIFYQANRPLESSLGSLSHEICYFSANVWILKKLESIDISISLPQIASFRCRYRGSCCGCVDGSAHIQCWSHSCVSGCRQKFLLSKAYGPKTDTSGLAGKEEFFYSPPRVFSAYIMFMSPWDNARAR